MKIALAQINPVLGDIPGNMQKVRAARAEATRLGADLLICPELVVCGYPPEDLVLRPAFARACQHAVEDFARETADDGPAIVLTAPWHKRDRRDDPRPIDIDVHPDPRPFNALMVIDGGRIIHRQFKMNLPNYGVFDEPRTFRVGDGRDLAPIEFRGVRLGFVICEDMWYTEPSGRLAAAGADILIAPHGSPFRLNAAELRHTQARKRSAETGLAVIFVNQVGGQDELVFDGGAFVMHPDGTTLVAPYFEASVEVTTWHPTAKGWRCASEMSATPNHVDLDLIYRAAVLGTQDYVHKSGFRKVLLGLSGGIDSALVAAIAVDALGADNVRCVMMPSRYTSDHSREDAAACARLLSVAYDTVPITPGVEAFGEMLAPMFTDYSPDVTEENIQSRLRGTLLMAMSNKFGALLLTTGNKSEMAVGYATLYGDMNGAYNPLKDIYKTTVFELARWRNNVKPVGALGPTGVVIPERIITKPPSAELREGQTDQDSLPPYDVLDAILTGLIEEEASLPDIVGRGFDPATVRHVQRLLYLAEYKRRQSPPGPKITTRNFGRDRRYPIVNRWREQDPA